MELEISGLTSNSRGYLGTMCWVCSSLMGTSQASMEHYGHFNIARPCNAYKLSSYSDITWYVYIYISMNPCMQLRSFHMYMPNMHWNDAYNWYTYTYMIYRWYIYIYDIHVYIYSYLLYYRDMSHMYECMYIYIYLYTIWSVLWWSCT